MQNYTFAKEEKKFRSVPIKPTHLMFISIPGVFLGGLSVMSILAGNIMGFALFGIICLIICGGIIALLEAKKDGRSLILYMADTMKKKKIVNPPKDITVVSLIVPDMMKSIAKMKE